MSIILGKISLLTILLYLGIPAAQGLRLSKQLAIGRSFMYLASFIAVFLHGYILYQAIDTQQGQNLSSSNIFSFITWLMALMIMILGIKKSTESLTLFVLPIAGLSIGLTLMFPGENSLYTNLSKSSLLHIFTSLIAFSMLGMAALQAIAIILQTRLLKKYPLSTSPWTQVLPPLETMESFLFQIIWVGFIFLSLSLGQAVISLNASMLQQLPKLIFSSLSWLLFAILLIGHHHSGWSSTNTTRWTLCGICLLSLAYFGSKIWMDLF